METVQLTEKQQQVKVLIYEQGKSQKEAAALAGVSEKSVGAWVKKFGWRNEHCEKINGMNADELKASMRMPGYARSRFAKRAQAKILVEQKGFSKKEAAKLVGVSERTLLKWTEPVYKKKAAKSL